MLQSEHHRRHIRRVDRVKSDQVGGRSSLNPPIPLQVLGIAHPIFNKLLPYHLEIFGSLRLGEHNKQIYGHDNEIHLQYGLHRRSMFGMVHIYTRLSQEIVDCACVSSFQREFTLIARKKCKSRLIFLVLWSHLVSVCIFAYIGACLQLCLWIRD